MRGLRNPNKRRATFEHLKNQKALIICLQETFPKQEDKAVWSKDWGGRIILSHGTEHSKGVCMLLNPSSNLQINTIESDPSGRYIILKVTMEGKDYFLINVCAPTDYREQENFIRTLSENLRRFPLNVRAASAKIKLPKKYLQQCHILRTDKKNLSLLLLPS